MHFLFLVKGCKAAMNQNRTGERERREYKTWDELRL